MFEINLWVFNKLADVKNGIYQYVMMKFEFKERVGEWRDIYDIFANGDVIHTVSIGSLFISSME